MSRAQAIREWAVVVLLFILIAFLVLCGIVVYRLNQRAAPILDHVDATVTDTRRVVLSVGGTAAEVRKAAKVWAESSRAQADEATSIERKTAATLDNVNRAVASVNAMVQNSDMQVNGALLPSLNQRVNELGDTIAALTTDADVLRKTIDDADAQVNSPDIPVTLKHVSVTTDNLEHATAATNDVLQALDRKVQEVLQPGKPGKLGRAWRIIRFLVWGGSNAGQISGLAR